MFAYNQPLGRLARLPLKLIPPSRVMTVRSGALKGAQWIAGSHTHGCWLGTYEADKQRLFAERVRPGQVVYDIGANVGFYTLLASRLVGEAGHVYAFEPLPRNLDLLGRHLKLNRCGNVAVVGAAVSDKDGRAAFSLSGHATGGLGEGGGLEVQTVALDSLALRPPEVVKMDIEGGEVLALKGAERLLREHRPEIFLATHGRDVHASCVSFLEHLGYSLSDTGGPDELLARPR